MIIDRYDDDDDDDGFPNKNLKQEADPVDGKRRGS